jgi:hypothetical protein
MILYDIYLNIYFAIFLYNIKKIVINNNKI